ncbi:MAG: hypothetical protein R3F59_33115 [Myxococcota bacterium]
MAPLSVNAALHRLAARRLPLGVPDLAPALLDEQAAQRVTGLFDGTVALAAGRVEGPGAALVPSGDDVVSLRGGLGLEQAGLPPGRGCGSRKGGRPGGGALPARRDRSAGRQRGPSSRATATITVRAASAAVDGLWLRARDPEG